MAASQKSLASPRFGLLESSTLCLMDYLVLRTPRHYHTISLKSIHTHLPEGHGKLLEHVGELPPTMGQAVGHDRL
jgi:hypothetical protein